MAAEGYAVVTEIFLLLNQCQLKKSAVVVIHERKNAEKCWKLLWASYLSGSGHWILGALIIRVRDFENIHCTLASQTGFHSPQENFEHAIADLFVLGFDICYMVNQYLSKQLPQVFMTWRHGGEKPSKMVKKNFSSTYSLFFFWVFRRENFRTTLESDINFAI